MNPEEKLEAIRALLNGEYDNEQLLKIGYLFGGENGTIRNIEKVLEF